MFNVNYSVPMEVTTFLGNTICCCIIIIKLEQVAGEFPESIQFQWNLFEGLLNYQSRDLTANFLIIECFDENVISSVHLRGTYYVFKIFKQMFKIKIAIRAVQEWRTYYVFESSCKNCKNLAPGAVKSFFERQLLKFTAKVKSSFIDFWVLRHLD